MRLEQVTSDALAKTNGDRYLLSVCVARRVSQLQNGAKPLVEPKKFEKPVDIALREFAEGLIEIKE
ncbi:MAG: DNA-directed RNA polymerase subunit omega [Helicobacteraceae bacterium]|jgi:DNA-directed RNA polymerase subunit omega|nr:DNA-directed RNA polymerase subunit omega [Helicobacteraceae bacterium]